MDGTKAKFNSGATSSERRAHYDSLNQAFLKRAGQRCTLGDDHHGRGNWMRALKPGEWDIDFFRDRYNHAIEHLLALREGTAEDDHIGAVAWFLSFAVYVEQSGITWDEILRFRTPEEEKQWRYGLSLKKENK